MIVIGFTGTRKGLTNKQSDSLREILFTIRQKSEKGNFNFYHGDAIGADDEAHQIAYSLKIRIEIFPSNINSQRAFNEKGWTTKHKPAAPLYRNKKILFESHRLIACPKGYTEEKKSGTWSTIRLAQRMEIPICIIWPNGKMSQPETSKFCIGDPFDIDKWLGPTIINSNGN